MRKFQSGAAAFNLFIIALAVIGMGGWVANVVKLVGADFQPLTGLIVARCIGVFLAPLGAVLGFV